jgi:hypothetical protein
LSYYERKKSDNCCHAFHIPDSSLVCGEFIAFLFYRDTEDDYVPSDFAWLRDCAWVCDEVNGGTKINSTCINATCFQKKLLFDGMIILHLKDAFFLLGLI